jgi:hypothetical protein
MSERSFAQILAITTVGLAACVGPQDATEESTGAVEQQRVANITYPDGSPHPVTPWGDPDLGGM